MINLIKLQDYKEITDEEYIELRKDPNFHLNFSDLGSYRDYNDNKWNLFKSNNIRYKVKFNVK